jgi:nicotinamidase/pyrazinamidase
VGFSAVDARRAGFEAVVIRDACRAIDVNGSVREMETEFARIGVVLMESGAV